MKFFYVIQGSRIKHYLIVFVAALFSAVLLYVEKNEVAVLTTSEGPHAIDAVQAAEDVIALTFDISWGDKQAIPILDVLKKYEINDTTFFLSGSWAERHPETVERIREDGHEIGNLGFYYEHYTTLEDDEIKKDIQLSTHVLEQLTDERPTLYRPPHGSFDRRVLKLLHQYEYTTIHWSVNSDDWKNPGTDAIVKNVIENAKSGDIVLLHASDSAKQTANALPSIIEHFQHKGFRFVTVTELIANTNIETKEIN